jgi:hypothetical protein
MAVQISMPGRLRGGGRRRRRAVKYQRADGPNAARMHVIVCRARSPKAEIESQAQKRARILYLKMRLLSLPDPPEKGPGFFLFFARQNFIVRWRHAS